MRYCRRPVQVTVEQITVEPITQNSQNQTSPQPAISTRLYVPGWWVHAWEQALVRQSQADGPQAPGLDAIVLPSLDITQLNLVAVLCAQLQQQMLADSWIPTSALTLQWNDVKKLISSTDQMSIAKLSTALEQLGGLRLAVRDHITHSQNVAPLFLSEQWAQHGDDQNDVVLTLNVNEQTLECLIGYVDGHVDFLRKLNGFPCSADTIMKSPPLVLWKPVWLELALAEQAVYLRLEKSMQWDMTWLQLDGVFGAAIDELFEHIRLAKRASSTGSLLMERLRVCGRLGRKLVSHGVIAREPQSNFFAVSSTPQALPEAAGPSIVWQASAERLLSAEENAYFGRAAQAMFRHVVQPVAPALLQILAAGTDYSHRPKELLDLWLQLKNIPGGALRVGPTTLIQAQMLFLEWSLRKLPGSLTPLPAELFSHDLVALCRLDRQPIDQFRRFCERVFSTQEASRIITDNPGSCLVTSRGPEIQAILPKMRAILRSSSSFVQSVPEVKVASSTILTSNTLPTAHSESGPKAPIPPPDSGQSALLRIAREELEKMMKADPRSFTALKDSYLKSLEEPQRVLMCDVERRMKPQLFDQQLKQRLVRFMVEHPAAWKSTSQILQ